MAVEVCPSCTGYHDPSKTIPITLVPGEPAGDGRVEVTEPATAIAPERTVRLYPCEVNAWLDAHGGEGGARAMTVPTGTPHYHEMGPEIDAAAPQQTVHLRFHVQPRTGFNPTGLVRAACLHGLKTHPMPEIEADWVLRKSGDSWIVGHHLDATGRCPVCYGKPAPADLTAGYTDKETVQ